jgi:polysaccharide export outer membrane protein|tara:strand:- start:58 stop:1164 length:1107 start_codon:yes stop_codon:yes gene_type:complete
MPDSTLSTLSFADRQTDMTKLQLYLLAFLINFLAPLATASEGDYLLRRDDQIKMQVYQEEELTTTTSIGKSGNVSFPLIGSVKLEGLTVQNAESTIQKLYKKDYIINAQINLSVINYAERWVVVAGEVKTPGTIKFPKEGELDLQSAIAQAGGLDDSADREHILVRDVAGEIKTLNILTDEATVLKHGDSLVIRSKSLSSSMVTVVGNINKPGAIDYPREGKLNILTAIALAGDFKPRANREYVVVTRQGKQIHINLSSNSSTTGKQFYLQAGDFVIVRELTLTNSTVTIAGNVNTSGTVDFPKAGNLDIVTAIALAGGYTRIANKKEVTVLRGRNQYTVSIKGIEAGEMQMFFLRAGDIVLVKESRF